MNNPISRMPNPMAPMGQVPSIPPMGANPTAQNPSAMPLPVVNQPSVDMQMMGTTANQRKKFNDMMESLSAPRQPVEKPVQNMFYGGMAGYGMPMMPMMNPYMGMGYGGMGIGGMGMNPYSMAYPSYTPGFGTTPTNPTTPTPTDTSQNPFGNTIDSGAFKRIPSFDHQRLPSFDPLKDYDPTKSQQQYGHIQPDFFTSPEWKDAYSYRGPGTMDAGWGKYFGGYGSGTINNLYNKAYQDWANRTGNEMIEMERPDYMGLLPNPSLPPVEDAPLDPPVTTMPIEPRPKLPWEQYAGKLAPIVDGEIKAWNSDWGEQPRDPRDVFDYDDPIMTTMANGGEVQYLKGGGSTMPIGKYSYSKDFGIGSFANGGPVQYLRGGGPTRRFGPSGPAGLLPHSGTTSGKKKRFDTSTNEDTTITDTASKIGNFLSNLFSGGKSVDTGYGDLTKPGSAFPGSDLNFSEPPKMPTVEKRENKFPEQDVRLNMPRQNLIPPAVDISSSPEVGGINMGILDMPAPMDIQSNIQSLVGGGRGADPRNFMQGNAGRGDDPRKFMYQGDAGRGGDPRDFMYQGDAGRGSDPRDFMTEPLISSVQDQEPLGSGMQSGQTPPEIGGIGLGSGIASVDPVSTGVRANVQSGSGADFDQPITLPGEEGARPENMTQIGGYNDRTGWMDQISRGNTIDPVSGYPYSIMISASRVGMTPEEYSNLSFGEKMDLFGKEMEVQRADMAYGLRKHGTALKNFDFTAPVDNYGAMSQGREGSTYRGPINTGGGNFFQEMIDKIIPPSEDAEEIPTPTPTATGGYVCPDGWLYDANTSSCVKQGKGFGGQGMNMGGAVSPSLNNAVDNFLQALA